MPYVDLEQRAEYHRTYGRKWARERWLRLREAGFCVACGVVEVTKYLRCAPCRAKQSALFQKKQAPERLQCPECGEWTLCGRNPKDIRARCKACNSRRSNALRWGRVYVPKLTANAPTSATS